eukprot:scaffold175900_cov33-Prasinocladus_malaysianus.AAC.1
MHTACTGQNHDRLEPTDGQSAADIEEPRTPSPESANSLIRQPTAIIQDVSEASESQADTLDPKIICTRQVPDQSVPTEGPILGNISTSSPEPMPSPVSTCYSAVWSELTHEHRAA